MRKMIVAMIACAFILPAAAMANDDELAKEETAAEATKDNPKWVDALKSEYHLTDEQIATMKDKGLNYPHMALTSRLAEKSGKSIDDIMKMRLENKIAVLLGGRVAEKPLSFARLRSSNGAVRTEDDECRGIDLADRDHTSAIVGEARTRRTTNDVNHWNLERTLAGVLDCRRHFKP